MKTSLDSASTYFDTYEARESAFRHAVGFKLARRHAGPSVFWRDFNRIARSEARGSDKDPVAYIPSNPRDCLAFGTPRQVLSAGHMSAAGSGDISREIAVETARRFEIDRLLSQPIRTLSGGETVKLALAKTAVSLPHFSRLVVASPFTWLADTNRHLLEHLSALCNRARKPLSILALAGEGDLDPIGPSDPFIAPSPTGIPFSLKTTDVRIPLMPSLRPLAARGAHAVIANTDLDLVSPCLVVGDNGQGKSLLARVIARAVPTKGLAVVESPRAREAPCLLFQDVLGQTLLRSFAALSHHPAQKRAQRLRTCYLEMQRHYSDALRLAPDNRVAPIGSWRDPEHSLVDVKAILVAARLAGRPAALILDEPDWGMSRASALAFVSAVLATAHRRQTPVLLISHKPWWRSTAHSVVNVARSPSRPDPTPDAPVFTLHLNVEAGLP